MAIAQEQASNEYACELRQTANALRATSEDWLSVHPAYIVRLQFVRRLPGSAQNRVNTGQ